MTSKYLFNGGMISKQRKIYVSLNLRFTILINFYFCLCPRAGKMKCKILRKETTRGLKDYCLISRQLLLKIVLGGMRIL